MQSGETGHVSAAEWRWVIFVSVFLVLLAFLLAGSYGWLFWQWRNGRSGGMATELEGAK